ncbi:hypothetical protein AB4524_00850 [Vibrio breoganii]
MPLIWRGLKMNNKEILNNDLDLEVEQEDASHTEAHALSHRTKPTYIDVKDGDGDAFLDPEEYVYLCDGVYVHKDECWF